MKASRQSFEDLAAQAERQWAEGRWRDAAETYRRLAAIAPDDPRPRFNLAGAKQVLGRLDTAVAIYRELTGGPMRTAALVRLASLAPAAISDQERAEMVAEARRPDTAIDMRIELCFALGALDERQELYDEAFGWFSEGARLKRETMGEAATVAIRRDDAEVEAARATFTADFIAYHQGGGRHLAAPIFIVGMPRSGSTLIEQILASHPKVQGLGERPALAMTIAGQFPLNLLAPTAPDHFGGLADAYLAAMHGYGWKSSPRFVDKMLGNFVNIGMIHLMFPNALILHAVRDPMDVCLANFRTLFGTGAEDSYDLAEIGHAYRRYRAMMDHWAEVLPGRVVEVEYEALIGDPDRRIPWLVSEVCGLGWDEACLRFHEGERPVATSSVVQVRRPIFTDGAGRWRRYARHLGPLIEALGPYAAAQNGETARLSIT